MSTKDSCRLALKLSADRHEFDGAWWPRSRVLATELPALLAAWPIESGYISRIFYPPPDWEDRPTAVPIPNRRGLLKTGNIPADDGHLLVLTMLDGARRSLLVIPPETTEEKAFLYLRRFGLRTGRSPGYR